MYNQFTHKAHKRTDDKTYISKFEKNVSSELLYGEFKDLRAHSVYLDEEPHLDQHCL